MSALEFPRTKGGVPNNYCITLYHPIDFLHLEQLLEWCGHEQASFSQTNPGKLADVLQAVADR